MLQTVIADLTVTVRVLSSDIAYIRNDMNKMRERVGTIVDTVQSLERELGALKAQVKDHGKLILESQNKIVELEDRSRCANIRILGFPEGSESNDALIFVKNGYWKLLVITQLGKQPILPIFYKYLYNMGEKMHLLALLLFALGPVTSVPVLPPLQNSVPGVGEYEENMMVQIDDMLIPSGRSAIKCVNRSCYWPKSEDGTVNVPYVFASNYSDNDLKVFKSTMAEYTTLTCVRLIPRTTETNYLNIMSSQGCKAALGRVGGGQVLAVDAYGCMSRGTIQHEINHALGFQHEHMRSDRDDYITVMYENISPDLRYNFDKTDTNNLGLSYDYGSVMHYNGYSFSNNGKPTIVPKPDPNVPIGQRDGLSPLDVAKINSLYECDVPATLLNEEKGYVSSPNYPSEYPNNTHWFWLIRVPSGQAAVTFLDLDLESSTYCLLDYIMVYDGPTKDYQPFIWVGTCGTRLFPPLIASSNQLLIEFSSDSSIAGRGFRAEYHSVQCGGTFFRSFGTFTSPGYPNEYGPILDCYYTITAPANMIIRLTVTDFETENYMYCALDYLEIFDGPKIAYGAFCGTAEIPDRYMCIPSVFNSVIVDLPTTSAGSLFQWKCFSAVFQTYKITISIPYGFIVLDTDHYQYQPQEAECLNGLVYLTPSSAQQPHLLSELLLDDFSPSLAAMDGRIPQAAGPSPNMSVVAGASKKPTAPGNSGPPQLSDAVPGFTTDCCGAATLKDLLHNTSLASIRLTTGSYWDLQLSPKPVVPEGW
ncbi:embryonic protein UVS.2-like [Dendropsophus ebraccatus]|uniref:embryonic protein UVS.2-like n=1 Tax=Dendropsophus ebraccatus TaxID=150705 RepID=UPI0038320B47